MEKTRRCLVTGATGVVGVPLVRELVERGHQVKVLVRRDIQPGSFPASVEIVRADLAEVEAVKLAAGGAEWIFHLAAKLHINNPSADLGREYKETNVEATARLLDSAKQNGAEKFVFFSTICVYGAGDGANIFDEQSEIKPEGFYAETKAEAEKLVLAERFGVALRLAAVYGSRMKGNYLRLLAAIKKGRFLFVGDGNNRRTTIHQQDAASAAIVAAEKAAGGSLYNVTDGQVHKFTEIVAAMSEAVGRKKPSVHLPFTPINFGLGLAEDVGNLLKIKSPVNRALLEKLLEDIAVDGSKIHRELGFTPQFDLQSGWRETVRNSGAQK
jgi:UDP-glucose 4-epimerase